MGNPISKVMHCLSKVYDMREQQSTTQRETIRANETRQNIQEVHTERETRVFSSTSFERDVHQTGLMHFDCEVYFPPRNSVYIALRFYALQELALDSDTVRPIIDNILNAQNHNRLQSIAQRHGGQAVFLVATYQQLRHPDLINFIMENNTANVIVVSSNGESHCQGQQERQSSAEVELSSGIRRFDIQSQTPSGFTLQFQIYILNDGGFGDFEVRHNVLEDLMDPENFDTLEDVMQQQGYICYLVATRDQLSHPDVTNFLETRYNLESNIRMLLYNQVDEVTALSDEEVEKIVGSPTPWYEGLNEVDCAICLVTIEDDCEEIKELACKHVYHYRCILRSTKTKTQCPVCRAEYGHRQGK